MKNTLTFILLYLCSSILFAQETKLMLPIGSLWSINSAKFSPDGKRVVISSDDSFVKIWDVKTGNVIHNLKGHTHMVKDANYSNSGKYIVTNGGSEMTARIYDATTGRIIDSLEYHIDYITTAIFSPDEKTVLTSSFDKTAKIWDIQAGKVIQNFTGHTDRVNFANFSQNGTIIVTTSDDKTAKIWDVKTGKIIHTLLGHTQPVISASFSFDNKKIVTVSEDNTAKIWDLATGKLLKSLSKKSPNNFSYNGKDKIKPTKEEDHFFNAQNYRALFSPDGQTIVTITNDVVANIWNSEGKWLFSVESYDRDKGYAIFSSINFSADGRKIVLNSSNDIVKVVNLLTQKTELTFKDYDVFTSSFSNDGKKILTSSFTIKSKIWDASNGELLQRLEGHTKTADFAKYSPDGKKIITVFKDNSFRIWNVNTGQIVCSKMGSGNYYSSLQYKAVEFSNDGKRVKISDKNTIEIFDAESGKLLKSFDMKKINVLSISPDMTTYIISTQNLTVSLKNLISNSTIKMLKGKAIKAYYFAAISSDSKHIVAASEDNFVGMWDMESGKLVQSFQGVKGKVKDVNFSPENTTIVSLAINNIIHLWNVSNGKLLKTFKAENDNIRDISNIIFSPSGKQVVINYVDKDSKFNTNTQIWEIKTNRSVSVGGLNKITTKSNFSLDRQQIILNTDDTVRIIDFNENKVVRSILPIPIGGVLSDVSFINNQFSLVHESEVLLFNISNNAPLLNLIAIDSTDWAVIHPSGLFDASPNAMEKMYWVKGDEIIELVQLKDRYWQPNLWSMVMSGKPLRSVEGMKDLKLQPEVEVSEVKDDILTIKLKKREGGYGKVSISINNKEVVEDARPKDFDNNQQTQTISINLKTHPELKDHLVDGIKNNISVKVQTADGFLSSRSEEVIALSDEPLAKPRNPAFYAVICGTGEYSNTQMNLKYPVIDANAIAQAITLGANNLFSKDSTHVYLLSSSGKGLDATTKQNIQKTFENIKAKAKPEDVVMVYLSGHGVTYGGEEGDFYYLTTEYSGTSSESFSDPAIRKSQAISTEEFTDWLNDIPALKQIMIIDACGSGKAVDNLIAKRDIESSQIKAIDRMKDRTGLFILSGCAANAVSYEANKFGQGLLTYTVLQAMRGMALRENKYVDVSTLLNYSSEEVPKIAKDIGGIQKPQMLIPKGGSFDIGIIQENEKQLIPLATVKPVFVRTVVFEDTKKRDILKLSKEINNKLNMISEKTDGSNNIVFIDNDEYPDACSITGAYIVNADSVSFSGSMLCGTNEKPIKIENVTKEKLVEQIVAEALKK
jgi:WD40 repeat protein